MVIYVYVLTFWQFNGSHFWTIKNYPIPKNACFCEKSFLELKNALECSTVLAFYNPSRETELRTDQVRMDLAQSYCNDKTTISYTLSHIIREAPQSQKENTIVLNRKPWLLFMP